MSIKRTKAKGSAATRRGGDEFVGFFGEPRKERTWEEHLAENPDATFTTYAVTSRFQRGQLIAHSTFGKGVVMVVDGGRIEVLFQEGRKLLAHGRDPQ